MSLWAIAFFLIIFGFLSIFVEFFLIPGFTIFGLIGLFLIGAGIFLSATQLSIWATVVLIFACGIILQLMISRFPKTKLARSFVLKARLEDEEIAAKTLSEVKAGDLGKVLTPLRPAGTVLLNGERYSALSEGEFISAGSVIEVISQHQHQLLVKEKENES